MWLYERWFDGAEIPTEELARKVFDASDEAALVASAEFVCRPAGVAGAAQRRAGSRMPQ
jgi:hypothetical protein